MTSITPCVWFDGRVQEALDFYTSVFDDAEVLEVNPTPEGFPGTPGEVLTARLRIAGQEVMFLNGGPHYQLSPAFSFYLSVQGQDEVDRYWEALLDGGEPSQCGWLTDRFGVSWQVIPQELERLMADPDAQKARRAAQAMLQMVKIDVSELQRAYDG